jgi:hypothetical protein
MSPHPYKRTLLVLLTAAALLVLSVKQGFGEAWLSGYTYASSSMAAPKSTAKPLPAGFKPGGTAVPLQSGNPPQDQESVQKPKPKPQTLSKRVAEYHIDVSLRESDKTLHGVQTVTWTNPGNIKVSELYFHLYPNAFESGETTFMRESGGQLREDKATPGSYGYMRMLALETGEGESLLPRLLFIQPDDGNPNDRTLAKLRLPVPVDPGKTVTLRMKFEVKLPQVFARMGYSGSFVMAGQWFPKLAVYETASMRGRSGEGWNLHQYHGNSEFYSDFGIYSVRIKVPAAYKVAASGFPVKSAKIDNGVKIYQFYADDVHDFAWSASPDFIYSEVPFSAPGVPGVRIKLYLDPLHAQLKDRYMHAAKSALAKYAQWYGAYPYSTLSIVVPPKGGNGAGGMEYPTLVTAFAADTETPGYSLERTVVHEIGHQYWYGMVATNEFEEAWLDEGFTSYAEDKVMESVYGIEPNLAVEAIYMTDPAPLKLHSWSYQSHDSYAENVYMRAKLVLIGIERQVGAAEMRKIMRTYFQKYKFKHPSTADFQHEVEKVTLTKWNDYFKQYVYGSQAADYAVESIRVTTVQKNGAKLYESAVQLRKLGGTYGPLPILLKFENGTTLPQVWDGKASQITYRVTNRSPLAWAVVDPKRSNVLDNKGINNFLKAQVPREQSIRWNLGIVKTVELLLGSLSW